MEFSTRHHRPHPPILSHLHVDTVSSVTVAGAAAQVWQLFRILTPSPPKKEKEKKRMGKKRNSVRVEDTCDSCALGHFRTGYLLLLYSDTYTSSCNITIWSGKALLLLIHFFYF